MSQFSVLRDKDPSKKCHHNVTVTLTASQDRSDKALASGAEMQYFVW
jgi:hypothetical protein